MRPTITDRLVDTCRSFYPLSEHDKRKPGLGLAQMVSLTVFILCLVLLLGHFVLESYVWRILTLVTVGVVSVVMLGLLWSLYMPVKKAYTIEIQQWLKRHLGFHGGTLALVFGTMGIDIVTLVYG